MSFCWCVHGTCAVGARWVVCVAKLLGVDGVVLKVRAGVCPHVCL